ncbi:hypothetical protein GGF50DRAFT_88969 [Schizophyllum commune]
MRIAFNPALGTTTRVAVPSLDGEAHMRLLAVLDEKEYAELKKAGAIVQAWSDMPGGGRCAGQWGELDFVEIDAAGAAGDDEGALNLGPLDADSSTVADSTQHTLALPLVVPLAGRAVEFAFTYRLLYPSGQVRWLGQFGNNGRLVVEREVPPVDLEGAWEGDVGSESVLDRTGGEDAGLVIARVRRQNEYEVCGIGGRPGVVGSPTLVLLPKSSSASLTRPHPIVISTIPHDASLTYDESSGSIQLYGKAVVRLDAGIPASHTSEMSPEVPGFAVLWAKHSDLIQGVLVPLPGVLSQGPRTVNMALAPFGIKEGMRYVVHCPLSGQTRTALAETMEPTVKLTIPPSGGSFAIAPLRTLGPPVETAILVPHVALADSALPTPPPSPPQVITPLPSLAQVVAEAPAPKPAAETLGPSPISPQRSQHSASSPQTRSSASSIAPPPPKRRSFLFRCLKFMFLLPFVFAVVFYRVVIKRRGRKAMLKTPSSPRSVVSAVPPEQQQGTTPAPTQAPAPPAVVRQESTRPPTVTAAPTHILHANVAPGKTAILLHPYDFTLDEHVTYEIDGKPIHDAITTLTDDGLLATFDSGKGGLLKITYA